MYRGIELGWLSKGDGLCWPEMVFDAESDNFSGQYFHPEENAFLYVPDGRRFSLKKGLILISCSGDKDINDIETTIAHEYRHHWQYHNWGEEKTSISFDHDDDRAMKLLKHYSGSFQEFDALRFEIQKCGSKTHESFIWAYYKILEAKNRA